MKIEGKAVAKSLLKLGTSICVDAMVCGVMVMAVPVGALTPLLGAAIVAGGGLVADGLHTKLIEDSVDEFVDDVCDIYTAVKSIIKKQDPEKEKAEIETEEEEDEDRITRTMAYVDENIRFFRSEGNEEMAKFWEDLKKTYTKAIEEKED